MGIAMAIAMAICMNGMRKTLVIDDDGKKMVLI